MARGRVRGGLREGAITCIILWKWDAHLSSSPPPGRSELQWLQCRRHHGRYQFGVRCRPSGIHRSRSEAPDWHREHHQDGGGCHSGGVAISARCLSRKRCVFGAGDIMFFIKMEFDAVHVSSPSPWRSPLQKCGGFSAGDLTNIIKMSVSTLHMRIDTTHADRRKSRLPSEDSTTPHSRVNGNRDYRERTPEARIPEHACADDNMVDWQ